MNEKGKTEQNEQKEKSNGCKATVIKTDVERSIGKINKNISDIMQSIDRLEGTLSLLVSGQALLGNKVDNYHQYFIDMHETYLQLFGHKKNE